MLNLIKKDYLTISRDWSEVLVLLVMPLILTAILSFALGGLMSGEEVLGEIPVAIVMENDFEKDRDAFEEALRQGKLPEEAIQQIIMSANQSDPASIFMDMFASEELKEVIALRTDLTREQAEVAIMKDEVSAIITIPERFSYDTLMAIYIEAAPVAVIEFLVQDNEQIRVSIVKSILTSFTEQYNLELSILQATGGVPVESEITDGFGEITYLDTQRAVGVSQYFTMGMAVMFALYVAATVSSNAFKEKSNHVFARLILSGERPLHYLLSKGISATVLTIMQLMILFIVSTLAFQTFNDMSPKSLVGMVIVTLVFSVTIGALATLLTAIALQFNSDAVSGIFSGVIASGFAFVGGSMLPVGELEQLSPLLREIGNWTPNGAMMTAYLQLLQGFGLSDVLPMIYRVVAMMVIFVIAALAIFPKRRLS